MKPDKLDILKELVKKESRKTISFDGEDNINFSVLYMMMEISDNIHSMYDESLTFEQNIEKYL